jgi:hypothetical protein
LAWNPETATLRDLYDALHLPFAGSWLGHAVSSWQRRIAPAIERVVAAEAGAMQLTIAALIEATPAAGPFHRGWRRRSAAEVAERIGTE